MTARRTVSRLDRHRPAREQGRIKGRYQRRLRHERQVHRAIGLVLLAASWITVVKLLTEIHFAIEAGQF
jgi:hypothetical protein